jgi:hypothetical protein
VGVLRLFHLAFLLFILPLAVGTRADEPTPTSCLALLDPNWTSQEQFVWKRVCAGEVADFNNPIIEHEDSYWGTLDPMDSASWPDSRILRPAFLRAILLTEPYRSSIRGESVHIRGARFDEKLDFATAELGHDLRLDRSLIEAGADFSEVRSAASIALDGSRIMKTLDMRELHIDEELHLNNTTIESANLRLADIGGIVYLIGSRVETHLNMERIYVAAQLLMCSNAKFVDVSLSKARVGGTLSLRNSKVTGLLDASSIEIGEDLELNTEADGSGGARFNNVNLTFAHVNGRVFIDGADVTGTLEMDEIDIGRRLSMRSLKGDKVSLVGARAGGTIDLSSSHIVSELNMSGLRAEHNLFMGDGATYSDVWLDAGRVAGRLRISKAEILGTLSMNRLHVGEDLQIDHSKLNSMRGIGGQVRGTMSLTHSRVLGNANLTAISVDGDLLAYWARFDNNLLLLASRIGGLLTLEQAAIKGNLHCWNIAAGHVSMDSARLTGPVTLNDARIRGHINLTKAKAQSDFSLKRANIEGELKLDGDPDRWSDKGLFDLRSAKIGIIPSLSDSWPPNLRIDGFTYGIVGAADKYRTWFRNNLDHHSPQPFEQLASVVEKQGDEEFAKEIRYEGRNVLRDQYCNDGPWISCAWQTVLKGVVGYGYYPWRAIWPTMAIVAAGMVVLWSWKIYPLEAAGGGTPQNEMRRGRCLRRFFYSLDKFLPFIELDRSFESTKLVGFPRYYFYGHQLAGFVIATFLVAALAGLTK